MDLPPAPYPLTTWQPSPAQIPPSTSNDEWPGEQLVIFVMWCRKTQTTLGVIAAAVFHFLLLAILISLQLLLLEVCDPEVNLQIILQNSKEDGDPVYSKKASDDPVLHTIFCISCWKYSSLDIYAEDVKIRQLLPKSIRSLLCPNISGPSSKGRMVCQSPTLAHIAGHYLRCTEGILQAHSFPVYLYQARQGRIKINMQYAYKGAAYLLTYCINKYWFATRSFSVIFSGETMPSILALH